MVQYRRCRVSGGTYFFTVVLADRNTSLLVDYIHDLRHAFRAVQRKRPYEVQGMVVLPEHLHAIWRLPDGDSDYPARWRGIKARFSLSLARGGIVPRPGGSVRGVWQPRYWEHRIRDEQDFRRHLDYIHYNPVKHGWVERVSDWPYSTFHRYVKQGVYPVDWGGAPDSAKCDSFGE